MTITELPTVRPPRAPEAVLRRLDFGVLLPLVLLVVLVVTYVSLQPRLLDIGPIGLVVQSGLPLILIACAQTFAVLVRGIDLSLGGIMVLANALLATHAADFSGGAWAAVGLIMLIGVLAGCVNGVLVTVGRLEPFIATLATWAIFGGLARIVLPGDGGTVPLDVTMTAIGRTAGVPNSIWLLVLLVLLWPLFRRTRLASDMYAVGGDESRARLRGINVTVTKFAAYGIAGGLAALGGLYLGAITSTGTPTAGDPYILSSVAAIVIGGTSLMGGSGGLGLTLMGAFILIVLGGVVAALSLPSAVAVTASSVLLVIAVATRTLLQRRLSRGSSR